MNTTQVTLQTVECIDGRKTLAVLVPDSDGWHVYERGGNAAAIAAPQLPGASLFVVYLAQKYFDLDLERAFEFAQMVHADLQMQPAFHVDTHGPMAIHVNSSDKDMVEYIKNHKRGCGFALFAWEHLADMVIDAAKAREWWIFLLCDEHAETKAHRNFVKETTYTRPGFENKDPEAFNMDMWFLDMVIRSMILSWPGFSATVAPDKKLVADEKLAEKMYLESSELYAQVVYTLAGIESSEIIPIQ